jgi:pimeloyl-ACP methyl ester carboxylesterase
VTRRTRAGSAVEVDETELRFRTIHGYRRAYRMAGSGPALLLLHGIGDSSEGWQPLIPALAEHFTVIAPDLLGHGASAKPRADYSVAAYANGMRDLLDVLGIERATVVGHSLGGGVAAQIAYQYPERCERLVLVASGGVGPEVTPVLRLAAAPFAELTLPLLHWPLGRLARGLLVDALQLTGTSLGRDADEIRRVLDGLPDGPARGAFTRTLRSVVDWRGQVVTMLDRSYLVEGLPVLLCWGTDDPIIPMSHGELARAAMLGSRFEVYDGAGHFPHHADPDRFVADLCDFHAGTAAYEHDLMRRKELLDQGGWRPPPEPDPFRWSDDEELDEVLDLSDLSDRADASDR